MYFVYEITLPGNEVYVGCTNDLRRRKDQHNENIRIRKGRFATYVSLNYKSFLLKTSDLKIIRFFDDRHEALLFEKYFTQEEIKHKKVLNDNYNIDCSRKGKNRGITSKDYVLIDVVEHTETEIHNLKLYCEQNNISYKDLQRTVHGNRLHANRYKVFFKEDWEIEKDKDYYLSGLFYKEHLENNRRNLVCACMKSYKVKTPNNEIIIVTNLDRFSREHGLTSGTLHATYIKGKETKGYKVIERI